MAYDFDWGVFFEELPGGEAEYWQILLDGVGWTLAVSALAWIIALVLGTIIGTLRTTDHPWLVRFGNGWVELFRNIPIIVQLFLWYFVVPEVVPPLKRWVIAADPGTVQFAMAVIGLGLFTAARVAEQLRAGIQSLPRGQRAAAMAVGLTTPQTYRYVLLPMAFRVIIPPLTSELMNIFKNSAVAFAIGVMELTFQARQMQEDSEHGIETYLAVTLLYFICAFVANRGMAWIEKRMRVPGYIVAAK